MIFRRFFILLMLLFVLPNLYAQRLVTGKVSDLRTKTVVDQVDVSVYKGTGFTKTNKYGYFQLTVQDDDSLVISHPDYRLGIIPIPEADVFSIFIEKVNDHPVYLDGDVILYKYLQENLKYPRAARNKSVEGIQVIQLRVDATGNIVACEALNDIGGKCAEETLEVFGKIPGKWSEHNEEKQFIFPIIFSLGEAKKNIEVPDISLGDGKIMEPIFVTAVTESW